MNKTERRLREVVGEIRRKPYPIKDLIPLLLEAAQEINSQGELIKQYEASHAGHGDNDK